MMKVRGEDETRGRTHFQACSSVRLILWDSVLTTECGCFWPSSMIQASKDKRSRWGSKSRINYFLSNGKDFSLETNFFLSEDTARGRTCQGRSFAWLISWCSGLRYQIATHVSTWLRKHASKYWSVVGLRDFRFGNQTVFTRYDLFFIQNEVVFYGDKCTTLTFIFVQGAGRLFFSTTFRVALLKPAAGIKQQDSLFI